MFLCHRGISDYFPENTLGSIQETFKNTKYSGVEIDILLTKDNKWIIYHDETLLRLNGIDKKVSNTNYFDITKILWKGKEFSVNLLSDLIEINFTKKFIINIEIKEKYINVNDEAKRTLYNILLSIRTKKFISSFDHDWFDWNIKNTNIEFACISENEVPNKGNFWILDQKLFEKINLIDIMEKNIKIGSYGNKISDEQTDLCSPLKYQIIDHKDKKTVYIDV